MPTGYTAQLEKMYGDALIALVAPYSKGTFNMVYEMARKRKPLYCRMAN